MAQLLMPKATAVWLVDNTALTFEQIAKFCSLHTLEVKAIADGESAQGIKGLDPINTGQLTREEIAKAEGDPTYHLIMLEPKVRVPQTKKKSPRYTPVSKRQDRPNAILWLVRNHPELKDAQISRLVGTTKNTITQIRDRTHWNSANLQPIDPVALGLCTQIDLDFEVQKAAKLMPAPPEPEGGEQLLPASQTEEMPLDPHATDSTPAEEAETAFANFGNKVADDDESTEEPEIDADSVFAKLKALKADDESSS
ncbi:MAG: cell cycle transcriptional regulator TrcR [Pseudomonadota bacterium]